MTDIAASAPAHPELVPALAALATQVTGLQGAVVASTDGFALAQLGRAAQTVDRLAAMTSSMLALAGALGRELCFGELDTLILDAEHGKVLMLAIPGEPTRLLMVACDTRGVIGTVLWHAKQCVRAIADLTIP